MSDKVCYARRSILQWPIATSNTCQVLGCLDGQLRLVSRVASEISWLLAYASYYNNMAVLSFAHYR
jgi:hypothetical protein